MKLIIHELRAAIAHLRADDVDPTPEDACARQADPAPAVRAVGRAGDADAVRIQRVPRRARRVVRLPVAAVPRDRVPARQQERRHARRCSRTIRPRPGAPARRCSRRRASTTSSCATSRAAATRCRAIAWSATGSQPHRRRAELLPVFKRIYENAKALLGRLPPVRAAGRRRGELPAVALPAHEDGRADHRLQARHRRLVRRRRS